MLYTRHFKHGSMTTSLVKLFTNGFGELNVITTTTGQESIDTGHRDKFYQDTRCMHNTRSSLSLRLKVGKKRHL